MVCRRFGGGRGDLSKPATKALAGIQNQSGPPAADNGGHKMKHIYAGSYSYKERFIIWLAWHLPASLAMWAAIRVITYASVHQLSGREMGTITGVEAIKCWPK
jgi:hypothetical protein